MALIDRLIVDSINPLVPITEKRDINQELLTTFVHGMTAPDLGFVQEAVHEVLYDSTMLQKAMRLEGYSYAGGSVKRGGHTSILQVNEFGVVQGGGLSRWVERPSSGGFAFLRDVVHSVDIIKAIILTYQRKVSGFCQPASKENPLGFTWDRKDGEKITKQDKKEIQRLEDMLMNSGDEQDPRVRKRMRRNDLTGFVTRLVWDSLAFDACPIETEMTTGGKLSGWYNIPAETIRLCTEEGYEGDDEITAVQILEGVPRVAYTYSDIIYEIRNPRTDLWVNGYGFAESEMIVRVLTAYLNSFNYNAAGLDRNAIPRGLLTLFGEYDMPELLAFKSQLRSMLHGASNRWVLPVLASRSKEGGAAYVPIDTNYNEMYFAKWTTLLVSICCAVFTIDPQEIHFDSFSGHASSPLSGQDTAEKLSHSRNKGLIPLLQFLSRILNQWLIPLMTKKYILRFTGLIEKDPTQEHELFKLGAKIREVREMNGQEPWGDEMMDEAPANPALMSLYIQKLQQQQMEQAGQDEMYPTDQDGNHAPYGKGEQPGENDFHTLRLDDGQENGGQRNPQGKQGAPRGMQQGKGDVRKAKVVDRDDFLVVLDRA